MSRRKARELAFKVLFQVDQVNADPHQAFTYLINEAPLAEKDQDFAWELINGSLEKLAAIDDKIAHYSRDWAVGRMSAVDRNLMRLACYEIVHLEGAQPVVAIDEAIEIAKKYGEDSSAGFINAILDKILGD